MKTTKVKTLEEVWAKRGPRKLTKEMEWRKAEILYEKRMIKLDESIIKRLEKVIKEKQ